MSNQGGAKWRCPLCHKEYPNFFSLKIHFKQSHKNIKECPACGRTFDSYRGFALHLRYVRDRDHLLLKALTQKTKNLADWG